MLALQPLVLPVVAQPPAAGCNKSAFGHGSRARKFPGPLPDERLTPAATFRPAFLLMTLAPPAFSWPADPTRAATPAGYGSGDPRRIAPGAPDFAKSDMRQSG